MRRPSGPTIAALAGAALTGLLYVSPVLKDVVRTGLDWPIWIEHPEGLIHTNAGKWLMAPPHRYFVEGASGEFPHYYPSLSDVILNVVGAPLGIPTMTLQAVLLGPLLGAAFLLFNYLSLAAVLRDRRVALAPPSDLVRRQRVVPRPARPRLRPAARRRAPRFPRDLTLATSQSLFECFAGALPQLPRPPRVPQGAGR
jgi:hypothetical protein